MARTVPSYGLCWSPGHGLLPHLVFLVPRVCRWKPGCTGVMRCGLKAERPLAGRCAGGMINAGTEPYPGRSDERSIGKASSGGCWNPLPFVPPTPGVVQPRLVVAELPVEGSPAVRVVARCVPRLLLPHGSAASVLQKAVGRHAVPALTHPCSSIPAGRGCHLLVALCSQRINLIISVSKTHLFHRLFHRLHLGRCWQKKVTSPVWPGRKSQLLTAFCALYLGSEQGCGFGGNLLFCSNNLKAAGNKISGFSLAIPSSCDAFSPGEISRRCGSAAAGGLHNSPSHLGRGAVCKSLSFSSWKKKKPKNRTFACIFHADLLHNSLVSVFSP